MVASTSTNLVNAPTLLSSAISARDTSPGGSSVFPTNKPEERKTIGDGTEVYRVLLYHATEIRSRRVVRDSQQLPFKKWKDKEMEKLRNKLRELLLSHNFRKIMRTFFKIRLEALRPETFQQKL